VKNPFPREPMWAREAVQGLEPGSLAGAGAGRDRLSDRDLTLGWVREYESGVCKVKKEIPDESVPPKLYGGTERVVAYLTEELVRRGHDVTLFAAGELTEPNV